MKKYLALILLASLSLFAASFDCAKATTKVEKMICQEDELSQLDEKLSQIYSSFYLLTKEVKTDQRAWMKKRNTCQDNTCVQTLYKQRIEELNTSLANQKTFPRLYLDAMKEAQAAYEKNKNVYKPIEILRKVKIDEIVKNRPDTLSPKQYSALLFDYATYLYDTADDTHRHINQQTVQKVLIQAKKYTPDDTALQLLLARSYLRHFKFAVRTEFGWGVDGYPYDESWRNILPSLLKQAYTDYITLCQNKNIQPKLTDEEWLIVKRQRLFIEYYSTFTKEQPKYGDYHEPYKKGFENICQEYVAQLNQMPDDEYMQCSRYAIGKNAAFIIEPPVVSKDWRKHIYRHIVHYKGEEFIDSYRYLQLKNVPRKSINHRCYYQFVDFNLEWQKRGNGESECYKQNKHFFFNQDTNTSNKKDH
jgi:uncharacterized protein